MARRISGGDTMGAPLIRFVLVAVDFGEASARAVAIGGAIAERTDGGTLCLVHSHSITGSTTVTQQQLDAFGREQTRVPFRAAIHAGTPDDIILTTAAFADLIVIGTHGRHGPKRWWLGSVAERVLNRTNKPVLVARVDERRNAIAPDRVFDRTLVHAATTETGEAALALASDLACRFGGMVTDARHGLVEVALEQSQATILVAAAPVRRPAAWMSNYGAPVVRFCTVPILFVPERSQ
jgi:nucleotide-binding universal stress UspA family protein